MENNNKDIIVGIDFGTSGIGFAYGFLNDPNRELYLGHFEGQDKASKISTEIILDDDLKNVLSFGNECKKYLCGISPQKFHHFNKIKMNLYKKIYTIKASNSNKEADIEYIIQLLLFEVKKKAIEQLKFTYHYLKEDNIHWVITVPAIWDNKSKQKMINAAQKAGLIRDDDDPSNFFALEPEAAAIYYSNEKNNYKTIIEDQCPYILCDLGGGTADIVTQKKHIKENGYTFEELYPPVGGDYGANNINALFKDRVLKKLFGEKCYNDVMDNISTLYHDWNELEKKIEEFKTSFYNTSQLISSFQIDCDIFSDYSESEVEELIKNFNSQNPDWQLTLYRRWRICFPYKIILDLMQEIMTNIIDLILIIVKTVDVKSLIFTGGASLSPILVDMIQSCGLDIFNYVKSHNPEVAIAYGAVLFSYDHNIISPRKAKYTFGIKSCKDWNEKYTNGGIKKKYEIDNSDVCDNIFSKFITKYDNLRPDKEIIKSYIMMESKINIELYKTELDDVTFCNEKNENGELKVFKFGEFIIDVGDEFDIDERKAIVKMKMGGTFITASTIYCKTGKNAKITCLYE